MRRYIQGLRSLKQRMIKGYRSSKRYIGKRIPKTLPWIVVAICVVNIVLFLEIVAEFFSKPLLQWQLDILGVDVFFLFFFLSFVWYFWYKRGSSAPGESNMRVTALRFRPLFFVLAVFIVLIVFSYRYVYYPRPQGADTPDYIYFSNLITHRVFFSQELLYGARLLIAVVIAGIRIVVESLLGFTYLQSIMIAPIVLGLAYCLSVYRLVETGTNNKTLAIMAFLATPMTILTSRMAWDLYAQLFALTLAMLFLSTYLQAMKSHRTREVALSAILLMAVFAAHLWTALFLIPIIVCFFVMCIIGGAKDLGDKAWITLVILVPTLIALVLIAVSVPIVSELLVPFQKGEINFFSLPPGWYYSFLYDTPLVLILAVLGGFYLLKIRSDFGRLVISWVFALFVATIVLGYLNPQRIFLLLPVPILVASGIYSVTRFFSNLDSTKVRNLRRHFFTSRNIIFLIVSVLLFQALFLAILPRVFFPEWVYTPSDQTIGQSNWLEQRYGYANRSVLILTMYDPQKVDLLRWSRAITGMDVYVGDILGFLNGRPDLFEQIAGARQTSYDISSYSLLALPSCAYPITNLEKALASEVSSNGVYLIKMPVSMNMTTLQENTFWVDQPPFTNWVLYGNGSTLYNMSSQDQQSTRITVWSEPLGTSFVAIEKHLAEPINASLLLLKARANLTNLQTFAEVYYNDGTTIGTIFSSFLDASEYNFVWVLLDPHRFVDGIGLYIKGYEAYQGHASWIEFSYIALM